MIAKIKMKFVNLKSFDWKLWISLVALVLVPAIYQVIRTYLLSNNVSSTGIDIVDQMECFNLIGETIKAFLIVPLYSILNKLSIIKTPIRRCTLRNFVIIMKITDSLKEYFS